MGLVKDEAEGTEEKRTERRNPSVETKLPIGVEINIICEKCRHVFKEYREKLV